MPPSSERDDSDELCDGEIQVVNAFPQDLPLDALKLSVDTAKIADSHPMLDARRPSVSTTDEQVSDGASIHSVATIHVTEPSSPAPDTSGPLASSTTRSPPSSPTGRSTPLHEESYPTTHHQRRPRHRSAIESRSSNRLSGFFSNLIHRRDPTPTPREPLRDGASRLGDANSNSGDLSRSSSPPPATPAAPPPPSLPAPTLQELGLCLSALTTDICPSHFSSPPSSGAFLSPHYLLLCHPQGLDVLSLISPPAFQPYTLVRKVNFKSVVVMEQRGVLVAIAGRRDGVRVYALEEVKRVIEWRMEVEIRRERDRQRRENAKKTPTTRTSDAYADPTDSRVKTGKATISSSLPGGQGQTFPHLPFKYSQRNFSSTQSSTPPPVPLIPRPATNRTAKRQQPNLNSPRSGQPPPYEPSNPQLLERQQSYVSLSRRPASHLVYNALDRVSSQRAESPRVIDDTKTHWSDSSDEEAIDPVAAGPSGSHLDERTSAILSAPGPHTPSSSRPSDPQPVPVPVPSRNPRRQRPANLNLSASRIDTVPPEPSPAPSLLSLRHALSQLSPSNGDAQSRVQNFPDADDDDDEADGQISLAQALMESRLPDAPPIGTRQPQDAILLTPGRSARTTQNTPTPSIDEDSLASLGRSGTNRRRRRWSFMINNSTTEDTVEPPASAPAIQHETFPRPSSNPQGFSFTAPMPLSASLSNCEVPSPMPQTSRSSRFLPRIISNVLNGRASEDRPPTSASLPELSDGGSRWAPTVIYQVPPPKLEYVKLPGTKGAVLIKAVETSKKSFLAILCGDHGEKVELFAGTYRTALGLSRTFILPDSPRSLELQLQGDDLVEVFLVFAQNVFGLEPATVRVREVRIGRAERRAARRRAREDRLTETEQEAEMSVNVSIGVSLSAALSATPHTDSPSDTTERPESPTVMSNDRPEESRPITPEPGAASQALTGEDVLVVTTAQMGAYTTFQQLSFTPKFPLASIADEYVIPPTYPDVLSYKLRHETENKKDEVAAEAYTLEQAHFTPPGLPVPIPAAPSRWFYRDPKNVVHGPWKASLMQAWYRDGLLPPELPVRREEDAEFIMLGELRLRCIDPTQPFRNAPAIPLPMKLPRVSKSEKPLLSPISLLAQPKHFGPPALFYSSRGGHSTSIVDSRGRSVLKNKFFWSSDDDAKFASSGKMGDIKRLESFDISERSLLVALRKGGLEVVDLGDALLKPADESRTSLPNYTVPLNAVGRRAPFIWKIGNSLSPPTAHGVSMNMKGKATSGHSSKKSIASTKNMTGKADSHAIDSETDQQEVLFLGRNEDDVYFCERNASSFRIIQLSPIS